VLLQKSIHLDGIYVGSRAMFEALNRAVVSRGIEPVIDKVFAFDQAPEAYRHLESGAHFGKVVISL
jgi:NADPH:quinone reductase-like Zn-dependent oxidoreductase